MTPKLRPEEFTFWVHGPMPGLNEIILAAKASPYRYSAMKKTWTDIVAGQIVTANHTLARRGRGLPTFDQAIVNCEWIEPHNRRDPDNVFGGGLKFILDGMERAGIIPKDSRKHIRGIVHSYGDNDKDGPGVMITVTEC